MIDLGEGTNDWMSYLELKYTYELPGSMTVLPEPPQYMPPASTGVLLQLSCSGGCCSSLRLRLPLPTKMYIHGGNRWVCKAFMCTSSKRVHMEGMKLSWTLTLSLTRMDIPIASRWFGAHTQEGSRLFPECLSLSTHLEAS